MKGQLPKLGVVVLALCMVGLSWTGAAQADKMACTAAMTATFQNNDGCEYVVPLTGSTNDDTTLVNDNNLFGDNWIIDGSVGEPFSLSGSPESGQGGTFDLTGVDSTKDWMIVVKDGANTTIVGFLYLADATGKSGTWTTPFLVGFPFVDVLGEDLFMNPADVSHFSAYTRAGGGTPGDDPVIPEPATLLLFGTGMAGLGLWRRIRKP